MNSAVMGRLTAGINKVCVKNRHVANYLEMEGHRDGSLFETAWMLILCESENGIYLPQRTQAALLFFVPLSVDTCLCGHGSPNAPTPCCYGLISFRTPCFPD